MLVFKVGKTRYSGDLSGEGARLHGGRWNHRNIPCVYCSESRALAVLEFSVNAGLEDIPWALSITAIEIPENVIRIVSLKELPANWQSLPAPASTKDFGSGLLARDDFAVFRLPSVVIPQEFNYLLNPKHPQSGKFKVRMVEDFNFDPRIKRN
jgi:RES domain-containing protein